MIDAVGKGKTAIMRNPRKKSSGSYSSLASIILTALLFLQCVPSKMNNKPVLPPKSKPKSVMLHPDLFKENITKLEIKLMLHDTASSQKDSIKTVLTREKIMNILFNLYIHTNNPEPDYEKALCLADTLSKMQKNEKKQLQYSNWRRILKQHLALESIKDSLEQNIVELDKTNKMLLYTSRRKSKKVDSLSLVVIDSLSAIIQKQKETINKLKELDVSIERQRSKMQ